MTLELYHVSKYAQAGYNVVKKKPRRPLPRFIEKLQKKQRGRNEVHLAVISMVCEDRVVLMMFVR